MPLYVVIGSNCFTGSHIVDGLLADPGNKVIGVSRSPEYKDLFLPYRQRPVANFEFVQIDVKRSLEDLVALLADQKPDVIINTVALSEVALSDQRPVEYFETNTVALVRLCNYLRRCSYLERYVHISSAEVFGSCSEPATEQTLFNPSTPYAVSKAAADMYLNTLIKTFRFPALLIRSTNVYGRHQQLFKIIPRSVIFIKQGRKITLHGGGRAIKSFIHVRDVVRGLIMALNRGVRGAYHFSVPNEQTVADVVRSVCTLMDRDFLECTVASEERMAQDARYWLDCSKASKELGWSPCVPLEQGVREVISWIESNWETIQSEPLVYIHKA
jgi:dTDP-glucose 4,6-dehydratase